MFKSFKCHLPESFFGTFVDDVYTTDGIETGRRTVLYVPAATDQGKTPLIRVQSS